VRHGSSLSVGRRRIARPESRIVKDVSPGSADIARDRAKHQGSVADEFVHLPVLDARLAHSSAGLQRVGVRRRFGWA